MAAACLKTPIVLQSKLNQPVIMLPAGKDILIIESPGSLKNDQVATLACYTIAEKVNAQGHPACLLLLHDYKDAES